MWTTRCRDCGAERHSGTVESVAIFALFLVGGVLSLAFWSPLLGALLLVGAISGLMWAVWPAVLAFLARRLSDAR